jgi:hypothetical protein
MKTPSLAGRDVFIAWDLRWMYCGSGMGLVLATNENDAQLEIALERPIPIIDASGIHVDEIRTVAFVPRAKSRATYTITSVVGTLLPAVPPGVVPTAELVLYPDQSYLSEDVIASVLSGHMSASVLDRQARASVRRTSLVRENIDIRDMHRSFLVSKAMLLILCDAAISGTLCAESLRVIAFAIIASSNFEWHDDLVAEVLHDWSAPEVNLLLNSDNLRQFRAWLIGDAPYPERPESPASTTNGETISEMVKIYH